MVARELDRLLVDVEADATPHLLIKDLVRIFRDEVGEVGVILSKFKERLFVDGLFTALLRNLRFFSIIF